LGHSGGLVGQENATRSQVEIEIPVGVAKVDRCLHTGHSSGCYNAGLTETNDCLAKT
jgi:hypothetical protein